MTVSDRCSHGARYGYTMACDVTACQDLGRLLARRESMAVKVLAGLVVDREMADNPSHAAEYAVHHADALLAELDK